jgi:ABC-type transport system substrate-binding protein
LKRWTFKLRQAVKWHNVPPLNGRALVADDIKYGYEAYATADSSSMMWEGWLDLVLQRVDEKEIDCPWSCARFVGFCIIRPALMTSLPSWHRRTM